MTRQNLATAMVQRPLYSVRELIGNFKNDAETPGRSRKIPFFPYTATVVPSTAQGRSMKKCISMPKGNLELS